MMNNLTIEKENLDKHPTVNMLSLNLLQLVTASDEADLEVEMMLFLVLKYKVAAVIKL